MSAEHRISRWETSATVAVDTNWFGSDIKSQYSNKSVKHTLQIMVPTSTVVNIQHKNNSITKVLNLNGGTALTANAGYQFGLLLEPGDSYNVQHKTGTQNVSCKIFESDNLDL